MHKKRIHMSWIHINLPHLPINSRLWAAIGTPCTINFHYQKHEHVLFWCLLRLFRWVVVSMYTVCICNSMGKNISASSVCSLTHAPMIWGHISSRKWLSLSSRCKCLISILCTIMCQINVFRQSLSLRFYWR